MPGDGDLFAGLNISNSPPNLGKAAATPHVTSQSSPSAVPPGNFPLASAVETVRESVSIPQSSPPPISSFSEQPRVRSAPMTDKLLGLLGDSPTRNGNGVPPPAPLVSSTSSSSAPLPSTTTLTGSAEFSSNTDNGTRKSGASEGGVATESKRPQAPSSPSHNDDEDILNAFSLESKEESSVKAVSPPKRGIAAPVVNAGLKKPSSSDTASRRISAPPPQLEDPTTDHSMKRHSLRGVGVVKDDTPIPNADVALRVFRKFATKTRQHVPESHGGTQQLSLWKKYVSGTPAEYDTRFDAYQQFVTVLGVVEDKTDSKVAATLPATDSPRADAVIDSVLGASGDTMAKARKAMAIFCHLLCVWSHVSAHVEKEKKTSAEHQVFCTMITSAYDTATSLVTHGCLDGVMIGIGPDKNEYHKAVDILAESVFSSDLSQTSTELSVMKFLLSTGCRVSSTDGCAMLRGSHLLQTIRVLYHVFLSTDTDANKTTARASLQQLVTSVFIRMIINPLPNDGDNQAPSMMSPVNENEPNFPSDNHRDAFLVLRSLCKLSMRNPPNGAGHPTNVSSPTWDASKDGQSVIPSGSVHPRDKEHHLVATHSMHPALESKVLALDLLLYVLNNTDMKRDFVQRSGPQFHYAIRNYLCVSILKNCTSDNTQVVNLSLRVFVPIIQNFRSILKTEIEAFVTNVFFVILDSKNSPIEHKILVVTLFDEICSDPTTLAEIFLNYDCDLSAVDLFHRIVNTLSKVARATDEDDPNANSTISLVAGTGAARMEKMRSQYRELRLNGMKALRQVLASLSASIVEPMRDESNLEGHNEIEKDETEFNSVPSREESLNGESKKSLVEIYGSKKKRREEEAEIILRFNQKPKAGLAYAAKCGHVDPSDPADVARFLLENKDKFEKTQIGEYLGREPDYENGFSLKVLHEYAQLLDFEGLLFDDAIRLYLSGFRLPGEAQKIDRIMEKFAEHYTEQNPKSFATADVAFILSFSIIMLNTDLHNPAIKEERRMTKEGFIRNNRGISDGHDLPPEMLTEIFDRIKENPISLKEDDEARERVGDARSGGATNALSPTVFFTSHHHEMDKTKESNFNKERDQIYRTTESLLKRRRHSTLESGKSEHRRNRGHSASSKSHQVRYVRTEDSGLRDEYVAPMFEVTWGPALAAFSTAMESGNGTVGALLAIASEEELDAAAVNAAETIEVCLTGFRFAICTSGLVGNEVARDAYMLALSRFSQLGTGVLLEPRHVRCIQTMLALARSDGELLGDSWEHIFRALSEINRFHQLFQLMARNDRAIAAAADRRKKRMMERERRHEERKRRLAARENSESLDDSSIGSLGASSDGLSYGDESSLFDDYDDFDFNDEMDAKEIDEANARTVYEAVSEEVIEGIYERSASMSTVAVKSFILQLCRVSRMEISHYGGFVGSDSNQVDLTKVQYRRQHELLAKAPSKDGEGGFHHQQTNIYNLQKLVEVTHYNMDSRPRLVFADIWATVSAHLTSTALHSNPAVAMYAVDSFRQLYIQYLQREELGVFEFQRKFLKPLETVMARSDTSTTKELLLKCVERIILMFGSPQKEGKGGMLRSGWRPVLTVLGLAGRDPDEEIAKMGFDMLTTQIRECLEECTDHTGDTNPHGVLLVERFIDLVDALLIYVEGPHEQLSLQCIGELLKLCDFLADDSTVSPLVRRRCSILAVGPESESSRSEAAANEELELWWPILLGLSRSVGDERKNVRRKGLEALLKVILFHFFVGDGDSEKQIQTLQLVYRGILTPILEFGDADCRNAKTPELPSDFDRFLTATKHGEAPKSVPAHSSPSWVDTMFDQFMDGCIQICIRSIDKHGEDTLIEEVLAMLNNCLASDSGAMAVKGLRRLELFLIGDLRPASLSDDTWATVSHMLRRCLVVRGIPRRSSFVSLNGSFHPASMKQDSCKSMEEECISETESNGGLAEKEAIQDFVSEDSMFFERRYIGSNAVAVIGKLLESERSAKSLGLRWRLFLVSGVGKGIREWEYAAELLYLNNGKSKIPRGANPPSYLETAFYARKWMNRFLLQLAVMKESESIESEGCRQANAQALINEQTQALVSTFSEKEALVGGEGKKLVMDIKQFEKLTSLVRDMLAGYAKLPNEHLSRMAWLNPVLSACIHTSNEDIRLAIQKLVQRLH